MLEHVLGGMCAAVARAGEGVGGTRVEGASAGGPRSRVGGYFLRSNDSLLSISTLIV